MSRLTITLFLTAIVAFASAQTASAATTIYFGEDINTTYTPPIDDPDRIPTPNSDAAKASFLSALVSHSTEDFESFADNDSPGPISIGTITPIGQTPFIITVPTRTFRGAFPSSGDNIIDLDGVNKDTGTIHSMYLDLTAPATAFGMFITDFEGGNMVFTLDYVAGGSTTVTSPNTIGGSPASGSAMYFGVTSTAAFDGLTILYDSVPNDGAGMDDFTVGQVPEPATITLLALGSLAALRRRK